MILLNSIHYKMIFFKIKIISFVIFFQIYINISKCNMNIPNILKNDALRECLLNSNFLNVKNDNILIHFNTRNIDTYLQHPFTPYTVVNAKKNMFLIKKNPFKYNLYVIVLQNAKDLQGLFNKLYLSLAWAPRSNYIVLYYGSEDINMLFYFAWAKYILNVIVFQAKNNQTNMYTYYPYKNEICGQAITAEYMGTCQNISKMNLFPNKVPNIFKSCSLRVSANIGYPGVIDPVNATEITAAKLGYEGVLVRTILERMNLTEILISYFNIFSYKRTDGIIQKPGTLYDVHNNVSDIGYGKLYVNITVYYDFDNAHVFLKDTLTWWVPKATYDIQWKNLLTIFNFYLWIAIILLIIMMILVFWLFSKMIYNNWTIIECTQYTWQMLLQIGIPFPQKEIIRYLFISWTISTLLLATAYQSRLLGILMLPVFKHQISNAKELYESTYQVGLVRGMDAQIMKLGIPYAHRLVSKANILTEEEFEVLKEDVHNTKIGYITSETQGRYAKQGCTMYTFKSPILEVYRTVYFQIGHPFRDRFNDLLMLIMSNGLYSKWIIDLDHSTICDGIFLGETPIPLQQIIGAFYLLMIGISLSFIVFIIEFINK